MAQVLFVCTGNICRSAFAERYAVHVADGAGIGTWQFASAGVSALVGAPMDDLMAAELESRGAMASGFASRQLTRDIIAGADLIVAMERYHRQVILDDHPGKVRRTFTLGQLVRIVERLPDLSGEELLEGIGRTRHRSRSEDDIADPYRQGAAMAARAADQIAGWLDTVLPRFATR